MSATDLLSKFFQLTGTVPWDPHVDAAARDEAYCVALLCGGSRTSSESEALATDSAEPLLVSIQDPPEHTDLIVVQDQARIAAEHFCAVFLTSVENAMGMNDSPLALAPEMRHGFLLRLVQMFLTALRGLPDAQCTELVEIMKCCMRSQCNPVTKWNDVVLVNFILYLRLMYFAWRHPVERDGVVEFLVLGAHPDNFINKIAEFLWRNRRIELEGEKS